MIFFFHKILDATQGEAGDSPKKLKLYTESSVPGGAPGLHPQSLSPVSESTFQYARG